MRCLVLGPSCLYYGSWVRMLSSVQGTAVLWDQDAATATPRRASPDAPLAVLQQLMYLHTEQWLLSLISGVADYASYCESR